MWRHLGRFFKNKVAVALLGAALIVGAGTTVTMAATGNSPFGAQSRSSQQNDGQHHDSQHDDQDNHTQNNDQHDGHQAEGAITSIDSGKTSFVVKTEHGSSVTVVVNSATVFTDGPHGFGDLKVGMSVEVDGTLQSDGTLTATRVHGDAENVADELNDDRGGSATPGTDDHGGSLNSGSGSSGSGGSGGSDNSGRGGHDDGTPHS
jgi:uncharacterized membrane protein YgcG